MSRSDYSSEEVGQRGKELYESRIRSLVETTENIGKIVSIDIESGDYEIDDDLVKAAKRLQARHPGAALWGERIGYNAVYALGGSLIQEREVAVVAMGRRPLLGTALLDGWHLGIDFLPGGPVIVDDVV